MKAKSGEQIPNPFKNPLVRRAHALAVDRGILIDKILAGYGTAAAQVFPTGLPGTLAKLQSQEPNYDEAKALLAKAGFPDGFNLILAGPAGRYPGDAESLQAVAQSWAWRDRPAGSSTLLGVQHETGARRLCRLIRRHLRRGGPLHSARASGVAESDERTGALNFGKYRKDTSTRCLQRRRALKWGRSETRRG